MKNFDVIVIGIGGAGSAALYHLARRGKRVLGIEQFDPDLLAFGHFFLFAARGDDCVHSGNRC